MNNETKIGALVVGVLVILAVLTWKTGKYRFIPNGYEFKVQFKDVEGLGKNAPVTLNGFEVGRVKDVKIIYGDIPEVELTLWLKDEARVPRGAKAHIRTMGFMGEKFVAITMVDSKEGFLPPGAVLHGEKPASLERLMSEGETIAANIKSITTDINERLAVNREAIDDIFANFRIVSRNLNSISTNVNERLAVNEQMIDDLVGHLNVTSRNLEEMSWDLKLNPWKLLYRPRAERKTGQPGNPPLITDDKK